MNKKKIQSHNNLPSSPLPHIIHMQITWETKAREKKKKKGYKSG